MRFPLFLILISLRSGYSLYYFFLIIYYKCSSIYGGRCKNLFCGAVIMLTRLLWVCHICLQYHLVYMVWSPIQFFLITLRSPALLSLRALNQPRDLNNVGCKSLTAWSSNEWMKNEVIWKGRELGDEQN